MVSVLQLARPLYLLLVQRQLCVLQLAESQSQYVQLQAQFEELKADFKYNLELLAERDAELEQADSAAATAAAELATKAATIEKLQTQLSDAQAGKLPKSVGAVCSCLHQLPQHLEL